MEKLSLHTRSGDFVIPAHTDISIVELAKKHKIPWGYSCQRGICAQCRTKVIEGAEHLNEVTEKEKVRLRKAERAEGYRLGCQITITSAGVISLKHAPY